MSHAKPRLKAFANAVIIAGVYAAVIAAICSYNYWVSQLQSAHTYQQLADTYTQAEPSPQSHEWYDAFTVDIPSLQSTNPDIIGWIYFENETISYPVLYRADDNSTYLYRDYTGKRSTAGSIFVDGDTSGDLNAARIIIYGHNMYDGENMFSKLLNYQDANYAAEHPYFQIITKDAKYRYQVTNSRTVAENDPLFTITRADLQPADQPTVILSTCQTNDEQRLVVYAKRINAHNN